MTSSHQCGSNKHRYEDVIGDTVAVCQKMQNALTYYDVSSTSTSNRSKSNTNSTSMKAYNKSKKEHDVKQADIIIGTDVMTSSHQRGYNKHHYDDVIVFVRL